MATTTNLEKLVINYLTQEQYDDAREAGTLNANELYLTPDTGSTGGTVTSIATGGGLTGGPITSSGTISHDDTSSQSSVSNSGRTYIQSVTLDTYGHVTGLSSATETVTNSDEKVKVTNYTTSNSVYPIFYTGSSTPATTTQNVNVTDFVYVLGTNDRTLRIGSTSKTGKLQLGQLAGYTATITPTTLTASQTYTLPNKTGTIALTSDIPTVPTKTSDLTNDGDGTSNFATMADIGSFGGGTVTSIATTSPISGGTITTTGTISHATSGVGTATTTAGFYKFKYDTYGHVTGVSSVTASDITSLVTIPTNTDENVKSLATATTAASSYYITGSSSSSDTTGTLNKHAAAYLYMTANNTTGGYAQLRLGNTTATSSSGGKEGQIRLYGTNATYYLDLKPGAIASSNKTITFPNKTGTVALTDDIPDVSGKIDTAGTGLSKSGTTLNHSNSVTAQTTQAVYPIKIDAQGHISAYGTAVTIPTVPGVATYNTAGLVKPWKSYTGTSSGPTAATASTAPAINAISNTSGKYYAVEMDSNGRMFVNVPWSAGGSYSATSPIDITSDVISHEDSGVTAGTYDGGGVKGSGFYVPAITVDSKGHVTDAVDLGNLIPGTGSSNASLGSYHLVYGYHWENLPQMATNYNNSYILSTGNTSASFSISYPTPIISTDASYFRIVNVEAISAAGDEVIVDWSVNYPSGTSGKSSVITLTVSIAEAYNYNIYVYPMVSYSASSM